MNAALGDARRLIVLAPIEPARTGNGLAMRTGMFCRSAPPGVQVSTVVVPVAGRLRADVDRLSDIAVVPADPVAALAGARRLFGDSVWRERLRRAGPLARLARAASPGLADAVASACRGERTEGLHVMRSYLAPLGAALADLLNPAWITLDLDDDDAMVAARLGDEQEAAAYDRLLAVFGPLFDGLSSASASEAERMSNRHSISVEHLPNAVDLPPPGACPTPTDRRREPSLLFVGNLTYEPNIRAACVLVEAILPKVRHRLGRRVRVTLVGPPHQELARLAGPDVELTGFVSDLGPLYATSDVVVALLDVGGGTRIKLLEAFAHGVPVVASPAAAAGLAARGGRHLLLAEGPDEAAAAIQAIVADSALAARLSTEARSLVRDRYSADVVIPRIREFYAGAARRAHGGGRH